MTLACAAQRIHQHALNLSTACVVAALILLQGCANTPGALPTHPAPGGVDLAGRLSLKLNPGPASTAPAQSLSAVFELQGHPLDGTLSLSTPLGTRMAQARWQGTRAELIDPQGQRTQGTLDELTQQALGYHLPVSALMSWLQGQPAPDIPSALLPPPHQGFTQLGWTIHLDRWSDRLLVATHNNLDHIEVRVKLDTTPTPASIVPNAHTHTH